MSLEERESELDRQDGLLQLEFATDPNLVSQAAADFRAGTPQAATSCPQTNFLKGCKWSPDGACLLTASEDKWLRIFDLPPDILEAPDLRGRPQSQEDTLKPALRVHGGELIYDYAWYPGMHALEPASCVFASTTRAQPVHLWDACTGEKRATYRAYDLMDEIEAAYSVAFSLDGSKVLAGYNSRLCIFDLACPGRESSQIITHKRKADGLPGIVSCMACNPDRSSMAALGAYSGAAALYALDSSELLFLLQGHRGGITQVSFSRDGNYLYTGARRDADIFCWDVRYTSGVVYCLQRDTAQTNQRIAFDIEPCGRHLATGGEDGRAAVHDLTTGQRVGSFQAASDTLNGFMFHPGLPLAATASGHRRLVKVDSDSEDDQSLHGSPLQTTENCLQIWKFSSSIYIPEDAIGSESMDKIAFRAQDGSSPLRSEPQREQNSMCT